MSLPVTCRDLEIWRRLHARSPADGGDVAVLHALAALPISRRGPYLGAILELCTHPDPALRAAAIGGLRGVRGVTGVRAIVAALADPATRDVALDALEKTARSAPYRYAHAVFHPDPEVRRRAVPLTPPGATELLAYLRADPACAPLVRDAGWP
ncbi:MAG: hypothetical protein M3680_28540, partial [Myxococcota bacterium]|nr:hypothetical protein [Myxococcota bacterium]